MILSRNRPGQSGAKQRIHNHIGMLQRCKLSSVKECAALLRYSIDPDKCKGCTACARKCPAGAIAGQLKQPHVIDPAKCIRCGQCLATCKFGAISVG